MISIRWIPLSLALTVMAWSADEREPREKNRNGGRNNWNQREYSGKRTEKDVRMAMFSKGFAWLSGSPADNEKLSVGKTAQFFGFVAVRYASGRVAQRGELGRAFYELATPSQREIMLKAAKEEAPVLEAWWKCRSKILRKFEHHLYTGEEVKKGDIEPLAREFGWLNAKAGLIEARGFAAVEDTLTEAQWNQLHKLRQNPGLAAKGGKNHKRTRLPGLSRELAAQYEDLYAKAFTWLTGTMTDNQTIPLGQPAQFFGFVSIRHKSGHGASRGRISRQFSDILRKEQQAQIMEATKKLWPEVTKFMTKRTELLLEMDKLRKAPDKFDAAKYKSIATELGMIEIRCGMIEATTYHQIRKGMTDSQSKKMMAIRSEYILDSKSMENLSITRRGQAIYTLCQTCHSNPQLHPLKCLMSQKSTLKESKRVWAPTPKAKRFLGRIVNSQPMILLLSMAMQSATAHMAADAVAAKRPVVSGTLIGRDGLLAVPVMGGDSMPKPIMGVGVSSDGTVYVTETVRQQREEISLIQSPFLHEQDMELISTKAKRQWIMENYSRQIAARQGVGDYNGDGKVDVRDLSVRSEKIYTLQDENADGVYDKATLFADGFNKVLTGVAHSVTPIDGHVYTTIIPDLWKLTDTDGDGVSDRRESIAHGFAPHIGYGNHDLHSIVQGYDGKLYWSMGDRGVDVLTKKGTRVSNPHSGCILRCNPDGSEFEVFASGLRNCQYFDFDNHGNIFTVDHDADFQGERERLVYLPEGSDSGWRMYYQYRNTTLVRAAREDLYNPWLAEKMWVPFHKGQPSHLLPAIENSWNAPAAFSFQPGTALGGAYRDHFFLGGKGDIRAFRMIADGAGFKRQGDHIPIQGLAWQVLTSTFGPDGRLYFTLWRPSGGMSQLWTLQAGTDTQKMVQVKAILAEGFNKQTVVELLALLGHTDRRIRQQAQFALVARREIKALRVLAADRKAEFLPRLHSLWGLGQLKHRDRDLLAVLCADDSDELRAQTARWAGELGFDPDNRIPVLLRDPSPRVRLMAGIACGKLKSKNALGALTELIVAADNKEPVLRHAGVTGLVGVATPRELEAYAGYPSEAMRIAAVVALRRLRAIKELTAFVNDASPQVMSDAVRAIYDEAAPQTFVEHPKALAAVAAALDPQHSAPVNVRAIAANRRLGTIASAKRISGFLATPNLSRALRVEALYALQSWPQASTLDPIDGRYFPIPAGDLDTLSAAIGPEIWSLANDADDKVSRRAIAVLQSIKPNKAQRDQVAGFILDEGQRSAVRKAWLRWLRKQDLALFTSVGVKALCSKSPELRVVAAQELTGAKQGRSAVNSYLLATLKNSGDTVELQRAIKMVPRLPSKKSIIEQLVKELIAGRIAPNIQLEVLETATTATRDYTELKMQLEQYQNSINKKGVMTRYGVALQGGDAEKGRGIFFGHAQAQCSKCHALKQIDKQVGPSLEGIAKRHSREYLLQSIVDPQAEIVPGYGIVTVQLTDGRTVSGTLMSESDNGITVNLPDNSRESFATSEIKSQSKPVGTMPDPKTILNLRQVRDLVAYLATMN